MKQDIVFFGSGAFTLPIINKLIPHGLSLAVTTEKSGPITDFCKKNGLKLLSARTAKELSSHLSLITNHSLGVLASYGVLIPDEIINSFTYGIINIHPSLLPKWKGPSPIQYTLLNGDTITGVTVIKMDSEFDHGPILSQKEYDLNGTETTRDLLDKLFSIGAEMVEELVVKLENGEKLDEAPQDHSKETWSEELSRESGKIDLSKIPTNELEIRNFKLEIERKMRAFFPWPGVWFEWKRSNGQMKIVKLLPNDRIQVEGKNIMSYKDFINGYGDEGKMMLEKLT